MGQVYKYGPIEPYRPFRPQVEMYGVVPPNVRPFPNPDIKEIILCGGKLSKELKKILDTYLNILCEAEKTVSLSKLSKRDKNKLKKSLYDCLDIIIKLEELMLLKNTNLVDVLKCTSELETGLSKFAALKKVEN